MRNRLSPKHHIMISDERKLILFLTPKCGNSTIKQAILKGCGYDLCEESLAGFDYIEPEDFTKEMIADYTTIVVLRNPFDRIVSCWQDKIMNTSEDQAGSHMIGWDTIFTTRMPFTEYVDALLETSPRYMNLHIRDVYFELRECGYDPDSSDINLFKMEGIFNGTASQQFSELLSKHGIDIAEFGHLNKSTKLEEYSDEIERKREYIEEYYHMDVELWKNAIGVIS